jgi:hypothetical protein
MKIDDWWILLEWAKRYCAQHNLALRTLFGKLVHPSVAHMNEWNAPSTKKGSVGDILRTRLKEFIMSENKSIELTLTETLHNWYWLHIAEEVKTKYHIVGLKMFDIHITYQEPVIIVIVDKLENGTELEILSLFQECKALDTMNRPWKVAARRFLC